MCDLNKNRGILGKRGALSIIQMLLDIREARFGEIITHCGLRDKTGADRLKELRDAKIVALQTRTHKDGRAYNVYVLAPFGLKLATRLGSAMMTKLMRVTDD